VIRAYKIEDKDERFEKPVDSTSEKSTKNLGLAEAAGKLSPGFQWHLRVEFSKDCYNLSSEVQNYVFMPYEG
jgi:hypothetical protein